MTPQELKALKTRRATAQAEYDSALAISKEANRAADVKRQTLQKIDDQIKTAETDAVEPIVTEHAILRFLERAYGIDTQTAIDAILSEDLKDKINAFKTGKFPISGYDCVAVVKNRTVITITEQ